MRSRISRKLIRSRSRMLLLTGVDFGETSVQDVVVVDTGAVVVVD